MGSQPQLGFDHLGPWLLLVPDHLLLEQLQTAEVSLLQVGLGLVLLSSGSRDGPAGGLLRSCCHLLALTLGS